MNSTFSDGAAFESRLTATADNCWRDTCQFYASDNVAALLLQMQERHQVNVMFSLMTLWLATKGLALSAEDYRSLLHLTSAQTDELERIRGMRKGWKDGPSVVIYRQFKQLELSLEEFCLRRWLSELCNTTFERPVSQRPSEEQPLVSQLRQMLLAVQTPVPRPLIEQLVKLWWCWLERNKPFAEPEDS